MKTLTISRNHFLIFVATCVAVFFGLTLTGWNDFQSLNILGFAFLVGLPGFLTLQAIEFKSSTIWGYLGMVTGFSLLELMFVAVLGNTVLPLMGIARPLDKPSLLVELYILIAVLTSIVWVRGDNIKLKIKKYLLFGNGRDLALAFAPIIFVVMSVLGAIRLNNGASDILTVIMLAGIAVYSAILIYYAEKTEPDVIPVALFLMSLSLLLMTSLRGWFTTGHDIQLEYRVFELTKNNGFWSIAALKNVYNACLSITILPTIFYNLLHIFDPYIYKVFFQIIFATLPGILYLVVRRYLSATIAFLSTFYFIAFPVFFTDMPFLNRQEIAFLFFGLMLYVIFDEKMSLANRRTLFLIFGLGMVLSHYSTTYTVVAILIFLIVVQPIMRAAGKRIRNKKEISGSAIAVFDQKAAQQKPLITVSMVIVLAVASFVWSSILTNTASNSVFSVLKETIVAIGSNTEQDAHANDVTYSLFSWKPVDSAALLRDYVNIAVPPLRVEQPYTSYYDPSTYEQYPIVASPADAVPLTALGKWFASIGIGIASLNYFLRQASAKVLQILIGIGFVFIIFRKKFVRKKFSTEFILLSVGSLIFVALQVLLPVLSVEYGVLRAFQQSLMFLGVFIVIGSLMLVTKLGSRQQIFFASVIALGFFLSSTGIFTQIVGGSDPQIYLNNSGIYYDLYYTHASEVSAINWLAGEAEVGNGIQLPVQADAYSTNKMGAVAGLSAMSTIYPSLIQKDAYIFLGYSNVHQQESTIFYNGTLVAYNYPTAFLNNNKNLIYNNGDVYIYR